MSKTTTGKKRRIPAMLTAAGLAIILLVVGIKGARLNRIRNSLLGHVAQVTAWQETGFQSTEPDELVEWSRGIRSDVLNLKEEMAPLYWLTPYLEWVPRVGPLIGEAELGLELADEGTFLLNQVVEGMAPAVVALRGDDLQAELPLILETLDNAAPQMAQAGASYGRILDLYNEFKSNEAAFAALPDEIEAQIVSLEPLMPFGRSMFEVAGVIPEMAGHDAPKTYLVILQNNDEMRATGGFISGVGTLSIDNGQISDLEFSDAYAVDNFNIPLDTPPAPLEQFMGISLLVFRDANYWPHFPQSAGSMLDIYSRSTGETLDGIIALDQTFVSLLVSLIEPVEVPELGLTLTGATTIDVLRGSWGRDESVAVADWFDDRKSFFGPVSETVLTNLFANFSSIDPIQLLQVTDQAMGEKHVQLYMIDPNIQSVLTQVNWAGEAGPSDAADVLMVTDMNMGFNKVNANIDRSLTYEVDINELGDLKSRLTVEYLNRSPADPEESSCNRILNYTPEETLDYRFIQNRCYYNYLRVFTPGTTNLVASSIHPILSNSLDTPLNTFPDWEGNTQQSIEGSTGFTSFENLLLVERSSRTSFQIDYNQSGAISATNTDRGLTYQLDLIKQAGYKPEQVQIEISLPPGSTIESISPSPTLVDNGKIIIEFEFKRDTRIEVIYR